MVDETLNCIRAGMWRIGMLWLEENHDLTPEQMTVIIGKIMRRT